MGYKPKNREKEDGGKGDRRQRGNGTRGNGKTGEGGGGS